MTHASRHSAHRSHNVTRHSTHSSHNVTAAIAAAAATITMTAMITTHPEQIAAEAAADATVTAQTPHP